MKLCELTEENVDDEDFIDFRDRCSELLKEIAVVLGMREVIERERERERDGGREEKRDRDTCREIETQETERKKHEKKRDMEREIAR